MVRSRVLNVKIARVHMILDIRVVTWYMGSGLKAQNMTGIRAQGSRLRRVGSRITRLLSPESGIRFITRSKNLSSQYFSA